MEKLEFNREDSNFKRKNKILESVVENKLDSDIYHASRENSEQDLNSEILVKALESLIKRSNELMPQKKTELSNLHDRIIALKTDNVEDFKRTIISMVSEFMLENFSFEEVENMVRQDAKMINRLIEYDIGDDEIDIHVPPTFVDKPIELMSLFYDAMKKLAEKFNNDPEFSNASRVYAVSWIVFQDYKILEKKFGFTTLWLDQERKIGGAEISKEKLIELYGK